MKKKQFSLTLNLLLWSAVILCLAALCLSLFRPAPARPVSDAIFVCGEAKEG